MRRRVSAATTGDWRTFAARQYRGFRVLAIAQGFIAALTGPAIVIPLLLSLGAHPALATALAVLPIAGTMAQRLIPRLLDASGGNMRGIVVLLATVGEPRGLLLAGVILLAAGGLIPAGVAIGLVAVIVGVLGSMGAIAYGMLGSWYQIVLAEDERRVVAPRLGAITLGIGSVMLLPFALVIDSVTEAIGLAAYAIPAGIAGVAGVLAAVMLRRFPSPGRVRVPRTTAWRETDDGSLRRHGRVMTLALLAGGLSPFLSVYAMTVLGTGAGFAIAVSAVSSATLVLSSLIVSSRLAQGSTAGMLRASFLLRGGALFLGLAAHPANPLAPLVIVVVAILLSAGDSAGQLAANERLMRLATGPSVLAFQSHYVVHTGLAYMTGAGIGSAVMLLGGWISFAILFAAAGTTRLVAARVARQPRTNDATRAIPIPSMG